MDYVIPYLPFVSTLGIIFYFFPPLLALSRPTFLHISHTLKTLLEITLTFITKQKSLEILVYLFWPRSSVRGREVTSKQREGDIAGVPLHG